MKVSGRLQITMPALFAFFFLCPFFSVTNDGFEFDFAHDRIMLDTRTPVGKYQGGGFGPTVQLDVGTLVTSYSLRGKDDKTHLEVILWKLPDAKTQRTHEASSWAFDA